MNQRRKQASLDELLEKALKSNHPPAHLEDMEDLVMKSIGQSEVKYSTAKTYAAANSWKASWMYLFLGIAALVALLYVNPGLETGVTLLNDGITGFIILSACLIAIAFQLTHLLSMRNRFKGISQTA
jgi:hypothetical protein